jgi:PAS domain S-box-containing protein
VRLLPENKASIGLAVSLMVVICFGITAWWSASRNIETTREVEQTRQRLNYFELTLAELLNIETGVRGFVLSGDEKFLEPYLEGLASVQQSIATAERLARDKPDEQQQLRLLEPLIQQKVAFVAETIQLCRQGDIDGARQRIASGQGKQIMDQIRKVIGQVEAEESELLRRRLAAEEATARATAAIVIASTLVSLALIGLAGLMVRHGSRKRSEAEAALRRASERLEVATRSAHVGIWDWNIADNKVFWDDEMYQLYGVPRDQFVPTYQAFELMIHPDDRPRVLEGIERAVRGEKEYAGEFRIVCPDKSIRYLRANAAILRDNSGKPLRMLGTNWDITRRKQAEEALRESEEIKRMITESVPQLVWMCRPDGWNIYFNQRWVDYTGLSLDESYGHGWNKPFHPDDQLRAWNAWKRATETGGSYDLECRLRRADGAYRWFLIRGLPVRNSQGAILKWFGTCTDIDDRKKAEEEIEALNARLEQHSANLEKEVSERTAKLRNSIESLQTLTYSMAHDLFAPIRAMAGYTHFLLNDVPLNETGKDYAARIDKAAKRMEHLVSDLLEYGRLTHLDFSVHPVDLKVQIENVLAEVDEDIRRTNARIRVREPMPIILGNERLLEQILTNLLSNALKFVAPGTRPQVSLQTETHGSMVRLWVEDNGIGLDAQYREKIFQLFQRLHTVEVFPGTGVGLAIVKRAAEQMGGQVGVESDVGRGSRFWIELPEADRRLDEPACSYPEHTLQ